MVTVTQFGDEGGDLADREDGGSFLKVINGGGHERMK